MNLKHLILLACIYPFLSVSAQDKLDNPFTFKWDDGFRLESQDEDFKFKFGGRMMLDYAYLQPSSSLEASTSEIENTTGIELRRTRLYISGEIYNNIVFKMDADISSGEVDLKDVYIGIDKIPVVGRVLFGRMKEPIRLTSITSSNHGTFMEGPENQNFAATRNTGVLINNEFLNDRLGAQLAVFHNASNIEEAKLNNNGYAIDARITGLLIRNKENSELLHLGAAYSYRKPDIREYDISIRPPAHLAPKYIGTGLLEDIDNIQLLNFEAFYLRGPLSLQAEYLNTQIKTIAEDLHFSSYYGQVGYFLTGESKNYKSSYSPFGNIKPNNNFSGKNKEWGAFELALKYSVADLNSNSVMGGKEKSLTFGINWYLNPVTRVILNHVYADIENLGHINITQARLHIVF